MSTGYETTILHVFPGKGKEVRLELEENRFHVSGGGQPGDTGLLSAQSFMAEVTDCYREGEKEVLSARIQKGEPVEGLRVRVELNLGRQALLSRMHSGEHILSRVLENRHEGLEVYKVAVGKRKRPYTCDGKAS